MTTHYADDTLVGIVAQRLKETNKPEQAAAFVKLRILHVLLDALSKNVLCSFDQDLIGLSEALSAERNRFVHLHGPMRSEESPAVLTSVDSKHQALVFDFDAVVERIGQLAMDLAKPEKVGLLWLNGELEILRLQDTQSNHAEAAPAKVPRRRPLRGSLSKLQKVGELSKRFQRPDLSDNRLRPTHFIRK
jgi:hypothetical protein